MKKIFLMACTAFLLVSCGTGNKYADEYISACKDAAGTYEDAADLKELKRAREDFRDATSALEKEYKEEDKELKRALEDFDEDILDAFIAVSDAQADAEWAYSKRYKELKDAE